MIVISYLTSGLRHHYAGHFGGLPETAVTVAKWDNTHGCSLFCFVAFISVIDVVASFYCSSVVVGTHFILYINVEKSIPSKTSCKKPKYRTSVFLPQKVVSSMKMSGKILIQNCIRSHRTKSRGTASYNSFAILSKNNCLLHLSLTFLHISSIRFNIVFVVILYFMFYDYFVTVVGMF